MSGAYGRLHWLLQEGWMLVPAKYCWYVRSTTTCTRYGEPWRPLSMPRGMWGAFCCMGAQWRLQYYRHKCRRLQYCLRQGGRGALFPQAYRVWSRYRGLTLCVAFSVRPWCHPSGRSRSDGPIRRRAVGGPPMGSLVGDAGSE